MRTLLLLLSLGGCHNNGDPSDPNLTGGDPSTAHLSDACVLAPAKVGACATRVDCDGDGSCEADLSGPDGCGICGVVCGAGTTCVDGHVCAPPPEDRTEATYPRFTDLSHTDNRVVGRAGSGIWIEGLSDSFATWPADTAFVSDGGFWLRDDGTVTDGRVADVDCSPDAVPLPVDSVGAMEAVVQLEGGPFSQLAGNSCARTESGAVWCGPELWEPIPGIAGAVDIATNERGCAVLANGSVSCWLGVFTTENPGFSTDRADGPYDLCLGDVVAIDGDGADSACVIRAGGTVACFGEIWTPETWARPMQVAGLEDIVEVKTRSALASAETQACARTKTGDVWCFGPRVAPFERPELAPAVALELGPTQDSVLNTAEKLVPYVSVCVLHPDGTRTCIPWDPLFPNGPVVWDESLVPDWCGAEPEACTPWVGLDADLEAADHATCGWTEGGAMLCWGRSDGTDPRIGTAGMATLNTRARDGLVVVDLPGHVIEGGMGAEHACALQTDGEVYCWGRAASNGILGTGVTDGSLQGPAAVLSGATALAVGTATSCAAAASGEVWCWGENSDGEARGDALYGVGTGGDAPTPALVGALDAVDVAVGYSQSCALTSTGTVTCWGNRPGEYGTATPPTDQGLSSITRLVANNEVVCAGDSADAWWCWGYGYGSLLADPQTDELYADPEPMPQMAGAQTVWPGLYATCWARSDGTVHCKQTYGFELPCGLDCTQAGLEGAATVLPGTHPVLGFANSPELWTWLQGRCEPFPERLRYGVD